MGFVIYLRLIDCFWDFLKAWIHQSALDNQELAKLGDTLLISCPFKRTWTESLLLKQFNSMICAVCNSSVIKVRCTNNSSPALSCVTVHKNTLVPFLHVILHLLAYHQDLLWVRRLQVLPMVIEVCDSAIVKDFRVVRKPNFVIDPIATWGVLPRFLKVENSANIVPKLIRKLKTYILN